MWHGMGMAHNTSIPLYRVDSSLSDASTDEPTTYASAYFYASMLKSTGVPAKIVWATTVTPAEFLDRRSSETNHV